MCTAEDLFNLRQLADAAAVRAAARRCNECGRRYSSASNLARHKLAHRAPPPARICPFCGKPYASLPALTMHLRTHTQAIECHICGKRFSRPWLLQGHIRTHTGEKPYKCTICPKAFADRSNFRAHVQTHSKMKPHICARCGKTFALKSYLCKHEESSCMKVLKPSLDIRQFQTPQLQIQESPVDFSKTAFPIPSPIGIRLQEEGKLSIFKSSH